jgi:hypothetical protein
MPIQTAQFGFVPPKQGTHDESGGYEHLTGKTDMSAEKITPPSDDDRDKQDLGVSDHRVTSHGSGTFSTPPTRSLADTPRPDLEK